MASYYLFRILAMVTMLTDYLGIFFFPDLPLMRAVGRIGFPLYAFCVSCGWVYTRKRRAYFARFVVIALLSQIFYLLDGFNPAAGFVAVLFWLALSEVLGSKPLGSAASVVLWLVITSALIIAKVDYALEAMFLVPLNCYVIVLWMNANRNMLWGPSLLYVVLGIAVSIYFQLNEEVVPLLLWLPALIAPVVVAFHKTNTSRVNSLFMAIYRCFYPLLLFVLFVCVVSAELLS